MKKKFYYSMIALLLGLTFPMISISQTWRQLPNSPKSVSFRNDDIWFVNVDTGWICNVDGMIYRTNDGGLNWITQDSLPNTSFRCLGFSNSRKGWAGNLGPGRWSPTIDTMPLYETNDGGNTWNVVTSILGPLPKGICGISAVNDSVAFAVGRVSGPAYFMKTINGGSTWISKDMSSLLHHLIDCKFFSADTGFIVGGSLDSLNVSHYNILYTTDGGNNWTSMAKGKVPGHGWKIQFINRKKGFVSVENDSKINLSQILITNDGGLTWKDDTVNTIFGYGLQGVGFVNDQTGWVGSYGADTKTTTDGGKTWVASAIAPNLNRIRVIKEDLAYAVGDRVWRYSTFPLGGTEVKPRSEPELILNAFPNPFTDQLNIQYKLPYKGDVLISIYDSGGRPIKKYSMQNESIGEHILSINIPYYSDAMFFVVLDFDGYKKSIRVVSEK